MNFYNNMHPYYCGWVADFCEDLGVDFILGHALYMKAIHGGKAKNDRIDSLYALPTLNLSLYINSPEPASLIRHLIGVH